MIINICKKIVVLTALGLFVAIPLNAEIKSMSDAVNKAGQQRMLTQRMLKDYALIGMNNKYGNPKDDLPKIIILFDENLNELQTYIKDSKSLKSLENTASLWTPIKKILQEKAQKSRVKDLQQDLEKLLTASHNTTELIAKSSGVTSADIVNTAGKQRMLSQRMASLYMLKVWDVEDSSFTLKLDSAMKEFDLAQKKLTSSKLNTDKIKLLLIKSEKAFKYFQMTAKSKSKKYIPSLINRSANKILSNMDTATGLYSSIKG